MDPLSIALMAVNVGASVFNNLRNNKQSRNLQIMQQEYTKAATERNTQRMWQLMREGQELAIELERESQDYRLEEIAKEFDNLLERMTYSEAIKLWPLKVLPIVMKNQSLGSAIGHGTEHIALHCILTPTNCEKFNKLIFPDIEEQLSDFFNLHWNNSSSHPILFYSGAWKSRTVPTGVEIKHLSVDLSKLPVLLITPFFKPEGGLLFQIRAWGIGVELDTEIECSDFSYAEKYKCGINYQDEKDIAERSIEEIIPYLQCLIGYIADQYFWACHNESPLLPTLLTMNIVNTDGMPYLKSSSEERYTNLLDAYEKEMQIMPFAPDKILSLFEGSIALKNDIIRKQKLEHIFILNAQKKCDSQFASMKEALQFGLYSKEDLPFIQRFIQLYQYSDYKNELYNLIELLESLTFDYSILDISDIVHLEKLAHEGNNVAMFRLGEIYEYSIGVDYDEQMSENYYRQSAERQFRLSLIKNKLKNGKILEKDISFLKLCRTTQSTIYLAYCYYYGYCIEKSVDSAMEELEKLSDSMHPYAYYFSAQIVKEQFGKDQGELYADLMIKSADLGFLQAQVEIADIFYEGKYTNESPSLCAKYAQKAALQGSPEGLLMYAICLIRGYGVVQDLNKAKVVLKLAAERGNNDAIEILKSLSK